jgi:hypothetical protein
VNTTGLTTPNGIFLIGNSSVSATIGYDNVTQKFQYSGSFTDPKRALCEIRGFLTKIDNDNRHFVDNHVRYFQVFKLGMRATDENRLWPELSGVSRKQCIQECHILPFCDAFSYSANGAVFQSCICT